MRVMMFVLSVVAITALAACGGGYAHRQASGQSCQQTFKQYDIGNRGYLTQSEFTSWWETLGSNPTAQGIGPVGDSASAWAEADTNGDNKLTVGEFCAYASSGASGS